MSFLDLILQFGMPMTLEANDLDALKDAVSILENPGFAVQLMNYFGKPIEFGISKLPEAVSSRIVEATGSALRYCLRMAVTTMESGPGSRPSNVMHKMVTTLSGAVGGAFGLPALAIELPISTTVILRSMMDIARSEGENIHAVETQLACFEVFAVGSRSKADDAAEMGYYATRAALARSIAEAARFIVDRGLAEEGAPAIVRLIAKVAARLSIPVSDKVAAQSVPVIGAVGGAVV